MLNKNVKAKINGGNRRGGRIAYIIGRPVTEILSHTKSRCYYHTLTYPLSAVSIN